ncbi:ANTAR domain-containing protein [Mycolicibacterium sp. P9-64]|uniref:GAF and ANTAR domain-containing protein n=1 Tax=Mycolicibacterium sp. P9-64 TaxID=2024612 RepID=UPI0011ED58B1|nr:GAF and ANTAR domain-containing protein [Mycolicibacterium sp. P9-64]KAA0085478.1 ANTAR domain-containing protein [Mycolicibacterium sp. P9-64]
MTSTAQRFMAALAEYPDGALGPGELCSSCVKVLPVDRAALTIGDSSSTWEPLGATDETAARIEAHQAVAGEGPAVDAAERGGPVLIGDLSAQFDRWPGFTTALGLDAQGSMFAFPLQIGAIAIGVLDLYRIAPGYVEPDELTAMQAVADIVTIVLMSRPPPSDFSTHTTDAWWTPSPSSSEIHQATGMVLAQLSVPPRIAYLRLRAYAFANDRPLIDVARDVIERRLRFDPDDQR